MTFYAGIASAYYDAFFPALDEQEIAFYAQHIAACQQPALEIGCGTGRILLPLLERGYAVEGFDASEHMLALCRAKGRQKGLTLVVYKRYMQDLALPKQYGCVFSPLGTFQHIANHDDAQRALQKFYEHLLPGGILLVYVCLPWLDAPEFGQWHRHDPVVAGDNIIQVSEKSVHDPLDQLIFSTYRYEVRHGNVLVASEEKELVTRWYSRYEFVMMLEKAGFQEITVCAGYEGGGPFDTMLFRAKKG